MCAGVVQETDMFVTAVDDATLARRSKLVAHIGEERNLHAIDFRECFRSAALRFIRACIRDGACNLRAEQLEKTHVSVIGSQIRADA
jgi:hypothetical protein